jgi:predicted anti-sigma-YlaC factor YlaD
MSFKPTKRVAGLVCAWRYRRLLSPYIDGELGGRRREIMEAHVSQCAGCREACDQMRFAARAISGLSIPVESAAPFSPEGASRARLGRRARASRLLMSPASAALAVAAAVLCGLWYYTHPSNSPWEVERLAGSPVIDREPVGEKGRLAEGEWLETDDASRARVKVGGIGQVEVEPNTRVQLVETRMTEHRLALERGKLQANIWAPPRLFFVDTPSAEAVDLGCAYTLEVDYAGAGLLHVTSGWVAFEREGRESKVPAGASCVTRVGAGPGTPYFDDAPERLRAALTKFDFEGGGTGSLDVVIAEARQRDTLTLYHLLTRASEADRGRVYDRLAGYAAPPAGVTREGVLGLDSGMLARWRKELEPTWLKESMPGFRKVWRWLWS